MKRACRLGDGWYGIAKELSGALDLVRRLRELEKNYQRPKQLEITLGLQWRGVTPDDVQRLAAAGIERILPSADLVARDSMDVLRKTHERLLSRFLR